MTTIRVPFLSDGANHLGRGASAIARWSRLPDARMFDEWRSTQDPASWPEPPHGDGRTAMLIPGFLAGDPSLSRMAKWLRSGDHTLVRSGIRWNVAGLEVMQKLKDTSMAACTECHKQHAAPVLCDSCHEKL